MKNLFLILTTLLIGFSSCEKPNSIQKEFPDGTYFGTFQRNLISGEGEKANISITFSSGKWSGQSDMQHYPALCNGTYKIENDKLIFTNDCIWTAEFDWSLILSGEYKFAINGDSLAITKDYGNPAIEVYTDSYCLSQPKSGIKKSPMVGTWVESISGTDTIVFLPEYDGQFPIFNLNRKFRIADGYTLPGYFSGPYWYILRENSISINWFLSSNSAFNRYYFKLMPEGNQLKIASFFSDPPEPLIGDTLTFTKIK